MPTYCVTLHLRSGYPKYFVPFLKPRHSVYKTGKSQADGVFLEVPHFAISVYKSAKHFGLSFAYDAPKIWNDMPGDVHSATSLHLFRKKHKPCFFVQAYPPFRFFVVSLYGTDPCCVSG